MPLIVKLTPNVKEISPIALAAQDAGADMISLINTVKAPLVGERVGGLSGPPIKATALRLLREVAEDVSVPIIGMGGISTLEDVLDFFRAGAAMVAIGTANFRNPLIMMELLDQLEEFCRQNKLADYQQLIGFLRKAA